MGLFDFFSKNQKENTPSSRRIDFGKFTANSSNDVPSQKGPVTVYHPKSFKDVESIITSLKDGKQTIVYLNELAEKTAYRVLDMLCGAIFALDGGVYELENNIFIFTPQGVSIK